MSALTIYGADEAGAAESRTQDADEIAGHLEAVGIGFERWKADRPLSPGASQDEVIAAYRGSIDRLMSACGFQSVDVLGLSPDHPDRAALRKKFLDEHIHTEDEVRFFVEGSGEFYLHIGERVYAVLCEKGDLIRVPANVRHWFDMGPRPSFTAIRLFTRPEGWVAHFTGERIAERFIRGD